MSCYTKKTETYRSDAGLNYGWTFILENDRFHGTFDLDIARHENFQSTATISAEILGTDLLHNSILKLLSRYINNSLKTSLTNLNFFAPTQ